MCNSIQSHGKENFEINILWEGECTQEELDEYEIEFISLFNTLSPNGYNLTEGGFGGGRPSDETRVKMSESRKGKVPTEATRAKMSAAGKGHTVSAETRIKISAANKSRVISPETRAKIGAAAKNISEETRKKMSDARKGEKHPNFGKKRSEETRAKLSEANKGEKHPMFGKKRSEETLLKFITSRNRPVEQWSRDGKMFIKVFESLKLAAHATGTNRTGISGNLAGKTKTAGGFVWRRHEAKNDV